MVQTFCNKKSFILVKHKITAMKKSFSLLSLFLIVLLSAFGYIADRLTGHWVAGIEQDSANVDFSADGSFKVTSNGQTANEGKYKLVKDTFFMTDNNCGPQAEGKYLLRFLTPDSVSFKLITDPCADRSSQVDGVTITRLKDVQK
jgi:hypothetical protein